jgi:predicted RNA-binding Zn-ribbon protein involved in translation (DUF1610 family)
MASTGDSGAVARAANELYWESDASVNQIADRLELSKSTLYGLIRPLPAEIACPRCGTEMVYSNRTALERAFLSCPGCEFEEEEEVLRESGAELLPGPGPDLAVDLPTALREDSFPGRVVVGAALIGVAAGMLLGRGLRSR